jgi:hypothetical protein
MSRVDLVVGFGVVARADRVVSATVVGQSVKRGTHVAREYQAITPLMGIGLPV